MNQINHKLAERISEISNFELLLLTATGVIEFANKGAEALSKFSISELIGRPYSDLFTTEDNAKGLPDTTLDNAHKFGASTWEGWRERGINAKVWAKSRVAANFDDNGKLTGYVVNTKDATELHWLHVLGIDGVNDLLNNTGDLLWSVDRNYRLLAYSKAYADLVRRRSERVISLGENVFAPSDDPEFQRQWTENYARAFAGETFKVIDYVAAPTELWLETTLYPIAENGEVVRVACHSFDITERYIAERKVKNSERRFRTIIENSDDAIVVIDANRKNIYSSPAIFNLLGYTPEEMRAINVLDISRNEHRVFLVDCIIAARAHFGKPIATPPHQILHKDGKYKWFEATITNWLHDEAIAGIVINMRDVTARLQAEAKTATLNRLYRFISEINQAIVHTKNERDLFTEVVRIAVSSGKFQTAWIWKVDLREDGAFLQSQYGMQPDEYELVKLNEYKLSEAEKELLETGRNFVCNDIVNDGRLFRWHGFALQKGWNSVIALPIFCNAQLVASFIVATYEPNFFNEQEIEILDKTAQDISFALDIFESDKLRLIAEEHLKHSELRLKQSQEIAHFGSWELSYVSNKTKWSDETCRIYGVDPTENEFDPLYWYKFIHPDDRKYVDEMNEKLLREGNVQFYYRIVRADGVIRYLHAFTNLEFDANGVLTGLYGVAHDVTDLKIVERSLAQTQENLRLVVDLLPHSIYLKDFQGRYIFVNKCFLETFEVEEQAVLGKTVDFLVSNDIGSAMMKKTEAELIATRRPQNIPEFWFVKRDGAPCCLNITKALFSVPGSSDKAILSIALDITNIKAAENERNRVVASILQRNKDLDQFSYIISHNLRSPVANIIGLCNLMQLAPVSPEDTANIIASLDVSAKKLDASIRNINFILTLKEHPERRKELVNFEDLVNEVKQAVSYLIEESNIKIITDFAEAPEMYAQRLYLYGIFSNLISNSIKYRQSAKDAVIEIISAKNNKSIELIFKDNGVGIDLKEFGDKMFGLYSRFHNNTDGAGMGLYLVKTQVELLGGQITVESEVNKGTIFKLQFATNQQQDL